MDVVPEYHGQAFTCPAPKVGVEGGISSLEPARRGGDEGGGWQTGKVHTQEGGRGKMPPSSEQKARH